ncbi:MAG: D-alanyl-D-alanine carboxypeptidase family protein [Porticoccaceae bacterium]
MTKRLLARILLPILCCLATGSPVAETVPPKPPAPLVPAAPQLAAKSWILVEASTGKVLAENNADLQLPPASLTKIMSSYIIAEELKSGKLKEDAMVPISESAWRTGGSRTFAKVGTEVPLMDLLRGVIIQSGNDATVALAEFAAGSEVAFADVMNQQADRIGMKNSHFLNATGWPAEGHLTTARDLALLARALIHDHPEHYDIYAEKYFDYNGIRQPNRNRLLWRDKTVDGIKTGHTDAAGYCLVSSAVRDGMRLISVVMGTAGEEARARESATLLSYGFRYYESAKVYSAGDVVQEQVRVWYGKDNAVNLVVPTDVHLTMLRNTRDKLDAQIHVNEIIEAPLAADTEIGRLKVSYQGELLLDTPLVADHVVEEAGIFGRLWDALVLFFARLFN